MHTEWYNSYALACLKNTEWYKRYMHWLVWRIMQIFWQRFYLHTFLKVLSKDNFRMWYQPMRLLWLHAFPVFPIQYTYIILLLSLKLLIISLYSFLIVFLSLFPFSFLSLSPHNVYFYIIWNQEYVPIAGHRHRSRCHQHRYSGTHNLSPAPEYSNTGQGPFIPVPNWFRHRHLFSFRYWTDWTPDSPASRYYNNIKT